MKFEGIYPPVITPHNEDYSIDFAGLETMIEHLIASGVNGIIVGGTTGEYYAHSKEERTKCMQVANEVIAGRLRMIAGIGAIRTEECIEFARIAKASGADAILMNAPYYAVPTQQELAEHALAVDQCGQPAHNALQLPRPNRHHHAGGVFPADREQPELCRDQGIHRGHQSVAHAGPGLSADHAPLRHGRSGAGVLCMGRTRLGLRRRQLFAPGAHRALPGGSSRQRYCEGQAHHVRFDAVHGDTGTGWKADTNRQVRVRVERIACGAGAQAPATIDPGRKKRRSSRCWQCSRSPYPASPAIPTTRTRLLLCRVEEALLPDATTTG